MARDYGLTIEYPDGTVAAFLQSASSATLKLTLSGVSTLDITFDPASTDGQAIYTILGTTIPVVRLARDGVTVFTGPLSSLQTTVDDGGGSISATFTDWVGMLEHWWAQDVPVGSDRAYEIVDCVLGISPTTARSKWPQNTARLTRSGTVSDTCSVNRGEQTTMIEMLNEAAAVAGFDWYVNHASDQFVMGATLGSNKSTSVFFGVGQTPTGFSNTNCLGAQVTLQPPRNFVLASNANNRWGISPEMWAPADVAAYPASGATFSSLYNYGEFLEIVDAGTHNAQRIADAHLRNKPVQLVTLTADPQLAPAWKTDYYLGDTVNVVIQSRAFSLDTDQRVVEISVSFDEQLVEVSNDLTFEVL